MNKIVLRDFHLLHLCRIYIYENNNYDGMISVLDLEADTYSYVFFLSVILPVVL
uniref:Uncharacterized protein n=1 Tax=Arundo donax TaxID=35708 RepID=A0A0A9BUD4_ARUDO